MMDMRSDLRALRDMMLKPSLELRITKAELQIQRDKVARLQKEKESSSMIASVMCRVLM